MKTIIGSSPLFSPQATWAHLRRPRKNHGVRGRTEQDDGNTAALKLPQRLQLEIVVRLIEWPFERVLRRGLR
jgi:hypothetical protein